MRIKEIRINRSIQQKDLAKSLGIAPNTLSQYENEKREPDIKMLEKMAECLQVSVDDLLGINTVEKKEAATSEKSDAETSLAERTQLLTELFAKMGYLEPDGDISDETLRMFKALIDFLDSYFEK